VRIAGILLALIGLLAVVIGVFTGFGSLFAWNGRHAVEAYPIGDVALEKTFIPEPGRRYTLGVQAVFDRQGLERRAGVVVVEAKMPLVVRVKDDVGTTVAEAVGWLDPNERPNVLYGHAAPEAPKVPALVVERLVGPFHVSSPTPLSIEVNLGPDRIGKARIVARRLVIHDDAWPPSIRSSFVAAGLGVIGFVAGLVLVIAGWIRSRAQRRASKMRQRAAVS
jgi:hypothetical protein